MRGSHTTIVLLSVLCLLSASAVGGSHTVTANRVLNWSAGKRCRTSVLTRSGMIYLPPRTKWYVAGLALYTTTGELVLGLRDYIGSHELMEPFLPFELGYHLGSRDMEVAKRVYGGEMLFENPGPTPNWGKLTRLNHTSSYVWGLGQGNNQGGFVVDKLIENYPNMVSLGGVNVQPYDPSDEHLWKGMPGNFRHDFRAVALEFQESARVRDKLPETLGTKCNKPISQAKFLERFLWLANYLEAHPFKLDTGYSGVAPLIDRWRANESLSDEEWAQLERGIDAIIWDSDKIADPILVLPLNR